MKHRVPADVQDGMNNNGAAFQLVVNVVGKRREPCSPRSPKKNGAKERMGGNSISFGSQVDEEPFRELRIDRVVPSVGFSQICLSGLSEKHPSLFHRERSRSQTSSSETNSSREGS